MPSCMKKQRPRNKNNMKQRPRNKNNMKHNKTSKSPMPELGPLVPLKALLQPGCPPARPRCAEANVWLRKPTNQKLVKYLVMTTKSTNCCRYKQTNKWCPPPKRRSRCSRTTAPMETSGNIVSMTTLTQWGSRQRSAPPRSRRCKTTNGPFNGNSPDRWSVICGTGTTTAQDGAPPTKH